MTQTVERRPLQRPAPPARRPAPDVLGPGVAAAAWALGAGLVSVAIPVLLAWAADARSGSGAAAATRAAGQVWLVAHGVDLSVPGGVLGLTPLGLVALPLLLLHRAGRHSARTAPVADLRQAAGLVLALSFPYGVAAALVAAAVSTRQVQPAPVQALLWATVVAVLGAGSGVLREAGLLRQVSRLPARARRLAAGTSGAVAVLLAGGAVLVGLSLLVHLGRVGTLAGATAPGLVGGTALLLLSLSLVPNAAVWGASWLAGPGFAVGAGTGVGPFGTTLGPVPALPLLAALPSGGVPTWLGVAALAVPVAAGVVAGLLVSRRLPATSVRAGALEAAAAGPCAGAAVALLAWLSGGPVGGGRLVAVGPSPWQVGLAVALEVTLPAAATAAVVVHRRR
ncbi:MAG: DUF6350 family protein [Mycobacteriales bacterium]